MNIEISNTQLLTILSDYFGTQVDRVDLIDGRLMAEQIRSAIKHLRFAGDQKILAIKTLRELVSTKKWTSFGMGLGDAKWAVEHLDQFLRFVETNNRIPLPSEMVGLV